MVYDWLLLCFLDLFEGVVGVGLEWGLLEDIVWCIDVVVWVLVDEVFSCVIVVLGV